MTSRLALVTLILAACGGGGDDGPSFQSEHPRILLGANRDRLVADLGKPAAVRWKATVDRWVAGDDVYGLEAWNAALLGQLTGDAKYCTAAVAAIDKQVEAAKAAIAGGEAPPVAGDSYLEVGEQIGDLALVYDWCFETAATKRESWLGYAQQAVFNVWHPDDATWGGKKITWSGWATDDPSDNYFYSFLRATMLLGLAAHDDFDGTAAWLTEFHDTRLAGRLIPVFEAELTGGGSREGTGYGVSLRTLFELYHLWQASTGEHIATLTGHTRASMLQFIHATVPTLDRVAPTGDHSRDSTAALFDYHRSYAQELISLFPTDPVAPRLQALLDDSSVPEMSQQFMFAHDFLNPGVTATQLDGLNPVYHATGIGELYARSGWDKGATWINLIAGPYTQSHAHQDQGSLMIYKGGWLAYDPNIESHSGLHQEVDAHNLVKIVAGGTTVEQKTGTISKLVALHRGNGFVHAAADLTAAYDGEVQKIERELVYLEPDVVVVYDRVVTGASTQQVWQLATPNQPQIAGTRTTFPGTHTLTIDRLAPAGATATSRALDGDFSAGFQLTETVSGGDQRHLHVLSIDGAATAITPEAEGVTLTVGGKTVTVKFSRDTIGGTLSIGGNVTTLGAGVDTLAE